MTAIQSAVQTAISEKMKLLVGIFVASVFALHSASASSQEAPVAGTAILGVEVNVQAVSASGYRASKLLGSDVYNDKDEKVGKVDDLIIASDGEVTLAILSVGGFLGLGAKNVAIPVQLFRIVEGEKITLPGATKKELENMSAFEYAQ